MYPKFISYTAHEHLWGPKGMLRSMPRLSQRSAQVEPCRRCRVWMYRMFFQYPSDDDPMDFWCLELLHYIYIYIYNMYIYIYTLWWSNTLLFAIVIFPWIDGLTLKNMLFFPSYVELPEGMLSIYYILYMYIYIWLYIHTMWGPQDS